MGSAETKNPREPDVLRAWQRHIGPILTEQQTLGLTGWSSRELAGAIEAQRILLLRAADGSAGYWRNGLRDDEPHTPIPGLDEVLKVWTDTSVDSWTVASWLSSTQPELAQRTPREALIDGDVAAVVAVARHASQRLRA